MLEIEDIVFICDIKYEVCLKGGKDYFCTNVEDRRDNRKCFDKVCLERGLLQETILGYKDEDGTFPYCKSLGDLEKFINAINAEREKKKRKKREFKKGDRVRVKEWDDMAKEFGVDDGYICINDRGLKFTEDMRYLCGEKLRLNNRKDGKISVAGRQLTAPMLEHVDQKESPEIRDVKIGAPLTSFNFTNPITSGATCSSLGMQGELERMSITDFINKKKSDKILHNSLFDVTYKPLLLNL